MRKIDPTVLTDYRDTFRNEKVMTIEQLHTLMHCSVTSVRRFLSRWNSYTSYNKNGRFYTLHDVPRFDENGLWWYHHIYFTKHRNLKNTIVYLVQSSEKGLSSREIGRIVGLDPSSFMHHFRNIEGLKREKIQGRFIYFSPFPEVSTKQKQNRVKEQRLQLECPSDEDAIHILVQFIKHPRSSLEELSALLAAQGKDIKPSVMRRFLESHNLLKKTQDTEPSPV